MYGIPSTCKPVLFPFPFNTFLPTPGGSSPEKCISPTLGGTKFVKPYPYWHKIWAHPSIRML